jgi:hypothetical protein
MTVEVPGYVMPVGSGAVGKTSVARVLDSIGKRGGSNEVVLNKIRKTNNLEFEFLATRNTFGEQQYAVTLQILVPPGQKQSERDTSGRSFEKIIDIYRSSIRRLDVVLFTYDIANRDTFHDLVYGVDGVGDLLNDATNFILLGTHLDRVEDWEVEQDEIEEGLAYLRDKVLRMCPTWVGACTHLEVSNLTGETLESLFRNIVGGIVNSRKLQP